MIISFVIPSYNASQVIKRALNSIFTVTLPKTFSVEVVVVDDGSDDSVTLSEVISYYEGVRLIKHDVNRGMCAGRNTGISISTGDIVTILDADDELVIGWFDTFLKLLGSGHQKLMFVMQHVVIRLVM